MQASINDKMSLIYSILCPKYQAQPVDKQKEVEAKLTAQNETMKSLVEKLQRVTTNMSKEIEHLKSTRS